MTILRRTIGAAMLFAGVLLIGSASTAHAAPLAVSGILFPAPGEADLAGGTVIDMLSVPVSSPSFTGTLVSQVISGDTTNPLGGLTFVYQYTNDASSLHGIGRLTFNGYAGWATDASYLTPTSNQIPSLIDRSSSPDVVGFTFMSVIAPGGGVIAPGSTSAMLVLQTDAPSYTGSLASVINGFVATVPSFAPVPEPATLALLCVGAATLAFRRRRSSR